MICLSDSLDSWHFPRSSNLSARAGHWAWASHPCHWLCAFSHLWEIFLSLALLRPSVHSAASMRVAPRGGLWCGSFGGTWDGFIFSRAGPGPGATRVTSGIEAGWVWSDTGSFPAPRQSFIMLPSPAQSSFVRGGRRWGLVAGSGRHSLVGRAVGPTVAWISA